MKFVQIEHGATIVLKTVLVGMKPRAYRQRENVFVLQVKKILLTNGFYPTMKKFLNVSSTILNIKQILLKKKFQNV